MGHDFTLITEYRRDLKSALCDFFNGSAITDPCSLHYAESSEMPFHLLAGSVTV